MTKEYKCEICGCRQFSYKSRLTQRLISAEKPQYRIVKCNACGLHSLYPLPSEPELPEIYNNYVQEGNRVEVEKLRVENVYPRKVELIKKYTLGSPKVLDIGSGLGGFCYVAKRYGLNVKGIEPENEQIDLAKKIFSIELENLKIEDILFKNTSKYDAIHMNHVLEHFRHPFSILNNLNSILTPEGIIIAEVPNQFFVFIKEFRIRFKYESPKKPYNPYHHLYFFSPHTYMKLFKESGFEILEFNQIHNNSSRLKRLIHIFFANLCNMGYSSRMEIIGKVRNKR